MRALVTGGGGFLGGAIVRLLCARGDSVRSLSRGDYPDLAALGVNQIRADLADAKAVERAVEACDVVYHVAAKAGIWGRFDEYYKCNVVGTRNVVAACRAQGVRRLVYTSSPSVVFDGRDMEGVDESVTYPQHYDAAYPATKAEAEQHVLAANGPELATVSLRPHLIWGPGDNHLVPRIVARGRSGRLRRIGKRNPLVDSIYIDNAADAHLLAADRLGPGSPIAGRAYFISQGHPWPVWDLVNRILQAAGVPPVTRSVPVGVARFAGTVLETAYRYWGIAVEPPMTRFLARELSTAHWFNITAARRDLGYVPRVSIEDGLARLATWLSDEKRRGSEAGVRSL
jgi:nucleoside-diphosphate-sugar epimerase